MFTIYNKYIINTVLVSYPLSNILTLLVLKQKWVIMIYKLLLITNSVIQLKISFYFHIAQYLSVIEIKMIGRQKLKKIYKMKIKHS